MIGILVQLALSWLIIWFYEKGNLSFLGFYPTKRRIADFTLFLFITAACCASGFLLRMVLAREQWMLNPSLTTSMVFEALWWNVKSVMFEELIFRGVIFYILIKKTGAIPAMLISSVAFGIYHWFSHEVFGDPTQMLITFFTTGLMGLLYAYGYAKTFSLFIPCAIHLGWNTTQGFIFSQGPIGNGVFIPVPDQPLVSISYVAYFTILLFPMLCALLINFFILRRYKQAKPNI